MELLKMIYSRIRDNEGDLSVELLKIGVNIKDNKGNYRDTYEILQDIRLKIKEIDECISVNLDKYLDGGEDELEYKDIILSNNHIRKWILIRLGGNRLENELDLFLK